MLPLAGLLTAVVGALLWTNLLPLGVSRQWVWRLRETPLMPGRASLAAAAASLLAALVVLDSLRAGRVPTKRRCGLLLALLIVLGAVAAMGIAANDRAYWVSAPAVIVSDVSMGYYHQALQIPHVSRYLAEYRRRASDPDIPDRVRTHPPGPVLFCYALRSYFLSHPYVPGALGHILEGRLGLTVPNLRQTIRNFTAVPLSPLDAIIALVVALILSTIWVLIALPAFGIGAVIFDRRVGLIMALLAISLPSLLHFTPTIDGLGAVLAATFVYLWLLALRGRRWWAYLLAGAAAAIMLMWSFGYPTLAVLAVAVAITAWRQASLDQRRAIGGGLAVCLATFVTAYAALYAWSGYNVLSALLASLTAHQQILASWGRSYWVWVPMNLYDLLLFMGPALATVAVATTCQGLSSHRWPHLAHSFVWGLIVIVGLLLISGSTRGEVGRIWVFLMPLVALPAAYSLAELREGKLVWTGAGLMTLQVVFAIVLSSKLASITPY